MRKPKRFWERLFPEPEGDEIIGSILIAMYANADYKEMRNPVIQHPSVTELINIMLNSLEKK